MALPCTRHDPWLVVVQDCWSVLLYRSGEHTYSVI
jgi:hypothetical protein